MTGSIITLTDLLKQTRWKYNVRRKKMFNLSNIEHSIAEFHISNESTCWLFSHPVGNRFNVDTRRRQHLVMTATIFSLPKRVCLWRVSTSGCPVASANTFLLVILLRCNLQYRLKCASKLIIYILLKWACIKIDIINTGSDLWKWLQIELQICI